MQQVLVFDFPQTIMNVKPEQAVEWGVSVDELYRVGIENVRTHYPTTANKVLIHAPKDYLHVYESTHFFVANTLFDLASLPESTGGYGCLVAAPSRHLVLVHPIRDVAVVSVIKSLCTIVPKFFAQGPGSLSREIFWYKAPVFTPLPYSVDDDEVRFVPPDTFMDLLNSLPEAK